MVRRKLRIAIVGLGRIGWGFHRHRLTGHRDWDLVAASDPVAERCDEAREVLGCEAFTSYDRMLDEIELDAVTIASPTHVHKAQALAAIRRGLHVMLEKPMAATLADAHAIVRAARRKGCKLTVYQPHRVSAAFQHLTRLIDSGKIGEVYHIRRGSFRFVRRDDWQALRKYGGGMLGNYGAHGLDQLLALTGRDVKRVFGQLRRVATLGDAEDVVKVVYETRQGVIGEIDINQATPHSSYELEVYGTRGTIVEKDKAFVVTSIAPSKLKTKTLTRDLASPGRKYPRDDANFTTRTVQINPRYAIDIYADLANAIRTDTGPYIAPHETLSVMKLMDQIRHDSRRIIATPMK